MSDITIQSMEFAPGQEPDLYDEDFATTLYATFSVSGKALAALLNKQERVLGKTLAKIQKDRKGGVFLNALQSPRGRATQVVKTVLATLKREAFQEVSYWAQDNGAALRKITGVEFGLDSTWTYWSAKANPQKGLVQFKDVEIDVEGRLDIESTGRRASRNKEGSLIRWMGVSPGKAGLGRIVKQVEKNMAEDWPTGIRTGWGVEPFLFEPVGEQGFAATGPGYDRFNKGTPSPGELRKAIISWAQEWLDFSLKGREGKQAQGLRKQIIRLAHAKPELRRHLLPLVKASS